MDQEIPSDSRPYYDIPHAFGRTERVVIAVGLCFLVVGIVLALCIMFLGGRSEDPRLVSCFSPDLILDSAIIFSSLCLNGEVLHLRSRSILLPVLYQLRKRGYQNKSHSLEMENIS